MSGDLLRTKLFLPKLRPFLVPRLRLIQQLNKGYQLGCKLILVSAPAGFGKSTLLNEWVRQAQPSVAWLSLDEGDNDLVRFFSYFVGALQTINSTIGQEALMALRAPDGVNIEAMLTSLLNDINQLTDDVILVLDDYHVIESPPIDKALSFLIDHLPEHMQLVIASRIDPSFPLSRLRAQGHIVELRAKDLRFRADEAVAFLNRVDGLNISNLDAVALGNRTEGWIAGLQLAALSMQGLEQASDISDFVSRFTGSDRYIQDYLTDEVLKQRPEGTRDFLLQTSILRRLCGPLCDAVRGEAVNNSQTILENLETANLFIIPLDNERNWYRYHHLFGDLLKHRLTRTDPTLIPELHQRASIWYENEGYLDDAIYHAKAADNKERIANLLEKNWQHIIHRGELTRLKLLLDSLGPDCTKSSAPLSMAYCWIFTFEKAFDLVPHHLKNVRDVLGETAVNNNGNLPISLAVMPSLVETIEAFPVTASKAASKSKSPCDAGLRTHSRPTAPYNPGVVARRGRIYTLADAHRELGEYEEACTVVMLTGLGMLKSNRNLHGCIEVHSCKLCLCIVNWAKQKKPSTCVKKCCAYIEKHSLGN